MRPKGWRQGAWEQGYPIEVKLNLAVLALSMLLKMARNKAVTYLCWMFVGGNGTALHSAGHVFCKFSGGVGELGGRDQWAPPGGQLLCSCPLTLLALSCHWNL